jgi:hypothetical protein
MCYTNQMRVIFNLFWKAIGSVILDYETAHITIATGSRKAKSINTVDVISTSYL